MAFNPQSDPSGDHVLSLEGIATLDPPLVPQNQESLPTRLGKRCCQPLVRARLFGASGDGVPAVLTRRFRVVGAGLGARLCVASGSTTYRIVTLLLAN